MRCPGTQQDAVVLSTSNASSICDGLLRMAHCLLIELPERELAETRCTIDALLARADQLLDMAEQDLSLNFDGLSIDAGEFRMYCLGPSHFLLEAQNPLGGDDFGAVLVSTSTAVTVDANEPRLTTSPHRRQSTSSRVPVIVPAPPSSPTLVRNPTPVPTPAANSASTSVPTPGPYPLVLSTRPNVGFPDYTNHPGFVRSGSSFLH